jgi:hypothetical protein
MKQNEKKENKEDDIVEVEAESIQEEEETQEEDSPKTINLFQRRKNLTTEFAELVQQGIDINTLSEMKQIAFYWANGLLPTSIKSPEEAIIVHQYAKELGIPGILSAFDMVVPIKNKAAVTGAGLAFLIRKAGHGFDVIRDYERIYETKDPRYKHALGHIKGDFIYRNDKGEKDPNGELVVIIDKATTIGFYRKGDEGKYEKYKFVTFTDIDAKLSGKDKEDTYKQYPSSMYFWKCLTHGAKQYFSEVIKGVNLPEIPSDIADLQVSNSLNEVNE